MFNTTGTHNFGIEVQDSTVTVLPGTGRIGNTLTTFDGSSTFFDQITDFVGTSEQYQNTLLFLRNFDGVADMTRSSCDVTTDQSALSSPVLPTDATYPYYSDGFPLSELTFQSSSGVVSLVSYTKM